MLNNMDRYSLPTTMHKINCNFMSYAKNGKRHYQIKHINYLEDEKYENIEDKREVKRSLIDTLEMGFKPTCSINYDSKDHAVAKTHLVELTLCYLL